MLIDDDIYRYTQIGIIFVIPGVVLIWAIWKGRFKIGAGFAVVVFFLLLIAGSVFTGSQATPALHVHPGGEITKAVLLGNVRYRFANASETMMTAAGRLNTLVVNDTDKPMAIRQVSYSVGGWGSQDHEPSAIIAPFSAYTFNNGIDYYGQGEHAPASSVQSVAPQTTLHWLTDATP